MQGGNQFFFPVEMGVNGTSTLRRGTIVEGNQPDGGQITISVLRRSLAGYPKCDTIQITFVFEDGIQTVSWNVCPHTFLIWLSELNICSTVHAWHSFTLNLVKGGFRDILLFCDSAVRDLAQPVLHTLAQGSNSGWLCYNNDCTHLLTDIIYRQSCFTLRAV